MDLQNEKTRREIEKIGEEVKQLRELVNKKTEKEIEKIGAEAKKLKQEEEQLSWQNSLLGRISTYAGAAGVGGIVGALLAALFARFGDKVSEQLNEARLEMMRQESNLALYRGLASTNERLQLAAAAVLVGRLLESSESNETKRRRTWERKAIGDVLVAVIKEKQDRRKNSPTAQIPLLAQRYPALSRSQTDNAMTPAPSTKLAKYIGDNIVKALGAEVRDSKPKSDVSPLKDHDWQNAQLVDVLWKKVDARGLDFFKANFEKASLTEAFLQGSVFYEAYLHKAILKQARLNGANLQGAVLEAADLSGADLSRGAPSDLASPTGVTILKTAILERALLKGANLTEADLSHANLKGANLTGAILQNAKLDGIQFDEATQWPDGFRPPGPAPT